METEKKKKSKTKKTVIAAVTAASVAVAGLTDSPDTIIKGNEEETISSEKFKEISTATESEELDTDEEEDDEEKKKKSGIKVRIREKMLSLPMAVRLFIIMPLWLLGSWIIFLSNGLLQLLSPFAGRIITAVISALLIIGGFLFAAKTAFPDLPIRKILNKKTLPWLLLGVLILNIADMLLPFVWDRYKDISGLIRSAAYLILTAAVFVPFAIKNIRNNRRKTDITEEPEIPEDEEEKPLIVKVGDETYSIITPQKKSSSVND